MAHLDNILEYTSNFPEPLVHALFEASHQAGVCHKVAMTKIYLKSPNCFLCNAKHEYTMTCICMLCSRFICMSCIPKSKSMICDSYKHNCAFDHENKVCKLTCFYRNFDVDRLLTDLREFSLNN